MYKYKLLYFFQEPVPFILFPLEVYYELIVKS